MTDKGKSNVIERSRGLAPRIARQGMLQDNAQGTRARWGAIDAHHTTAYRTKLYTVVKGEITLVYDSEQE